MQRVALVCGYNGSGYYGLQRQSDGAGKPTIELELERALVAAGALRASHAGALYRVNWSRTSRTDKGVSAAANVISLDVPAHVMAATAAATTAAATASSSPESATHRHNAAATDGADDRSGSDDGGDGAAALVSSLNVALPPAVRVWGVVCGDAGFDARRAAYGRRYEYLLPVWALDPAVGQPRAQPQQPQPPAASTQPSGSNTGTATGATTATCATTATGTSVAAAQQTGGGGSATGGGGGFTGGGGGSTTAERSAARAAAEIAGSRYALSSLELKRLNLILGVFVGSHCFHNFTSEPCDDPQELRRNIHRAYAEGPVYLRPLQQQAADAQPLPRQAAQPQPVSAAGSALSTAPTDTPLPPQAGAGTDAKPVSSPSTCASLEQQGQPRGSQLAAAPPPAEAPGDQGQPPAPGPKSDPAQCGNPDSEPYVRIVFLGSGFLMHQIRRMVGLALAVARRAAPPDCIRTALDPGRRHLTVPTAPPTGLLMDRGFFTSESYRVACESQPGAQPGAQQRQHEQRLGTGGAGGGAGGCRREVERSSVGAGEAFKRRVLYPAIQDAGPVEVWLFLRGLTESAFGFRTWAKRPGAPAPPRVAAAAPQATPAGPAGKAANGGTEQQAGTRDECGVGIQAGAGGAAEAAALSKAAPCGVSGVSGGAAGAAGRDGVLVHAGDGQAEGASEGASADGECKRETCAAGRSQAAEQQGDGGERPAKRQATRGPGE